MFEAAMDPATKTAATSTATTTANIMASLTNENLSTSVMSPTPNDASLNTTLKNSRNNNNNNLSPASAFTPVRPVLTPILHTPRGSLGLVLLSPSRTITESLNALASSTAQQLEKIWDEVGYTPQERASQLSDLLMKFKDQCEQKIHEEQGVAETFRQTITDSKEEIQTLAAALKVAVDPQLLVPPADVGGGGAQEGADDHRHSSHHHQNEMTLTEELANIETTVEGLRAEASMARQDLQECLEFLIESHQALGVPLDDNWNDIESDLTLARRKNFHAKVDEMKQEVSTRTSAVLQLLRDCQQLMNDLGMDPNQDEKASLLDRRIAGSLIRSKDSSFIMASKFETDTCTGIGAKALESLTTRATELSQEKKRRKTLLQDMGQEIAMLWEQLRISEEEQQAFTVSVKGIGMDTIAKGRAELDRLKSLKSGMLGKLVAEARNSIRELWEETNATGEQRQSFQAMNVRDENLFDDELLDQHEEYIKVLMERLENMKPIIRIIGRREDILRERMEYEELQKDSDRLKQRGAAMAKQLMEEERMARRIKRDLPKLTKHLLEKLEEWKTTHDEDFVVDGEVYVKAMARQEEEWQEYKQNEMQLKLRKKQDDQVMEENRFLGKPVGPLKRNPSTRALGDSIRPAHSNTALGASRAGKDTSDQKVLRGSHTSSQHPTNSRQRTFTS